MSIKKYGWIPVSLVALTIAGNKALRADAKPESPQTSEQVRQLRNNVREMWRANIQPPSQTGPRTDLREAISRARSLRVKRDSAAPVPRQPATTLPATRAAATAPDVREPRRALSPETLDKLRKLPKDAPARALELADAMFRDSRYAAALVFYDRAFSTAQDEATKAWALFQKANCLKSSDADAALKAYKQLVAEYGESVWAPLGAAQGRVLQWKQQYKPTATLKDADRQVRAVNAAQPAPAETDADAPAGKGGKNVSESSK